jgi:cation transport protein ChaC
MTTDILSDGRLPGRASRPLALTRDLIDRAFPSPVPDCEPAMRGLSKAEQAAYLEAALSGRDGAGGVWVFGYGSLLWKPEAEFVEGRLATVLGWHRRFCLWQWRHRGSLERPGLMLALDRGGAVTGVAYRIAGPDIRAGLAAVWRREMSGNGYRPRWVTARIAGARITALTFVAHRGGERYAGRLTDAQIADRIASACGHAGPSADYLFATAARCEELGIRDAHLWRLQSLVAERLARAAPPP